MDHLLSLSQAARMVGVRRRSLQQLIQQGRLSVFEGSIRMSELMKEFPEVENDDSGMIEKMRRIQDGALYKFHPDSLPDAEQLAAELHRMRLDLGDAQLELEKYRQMTAELQQRLYTIQDQCDKRQGAILGTLITWLAHQVKQHV